MIDKELQKECQRKAIKKVAENYNRTQKYVKDISNRRTRETRLTNIYEIQIQNAVKNRTVDYYNKEMQKRHLPKEE